MVLHNEIFFDPVTFGNSNYDRTQRIGVEFGDTIDIMKFVNIDFLDKLEFFTNYSWQDPEFGKGANKRKDIPMAPRYQVSSGFSTEFWKHYDWSITGRYVGPRFAINDVQNVTSPVKQYYTLDTKLAYRHKNFEIYTGVNNITNTFYDAFTSKSTFSNTKSHFPAPERNYIWGMNVKF